MRPLLVLAIAATAVAGSAFAQTAVPGGGAGSVPPGEVGSTINGGLPEKTGATTAVGQTKPPGAAIGDRMGTRPDLEEESRRLSRKIETGICTGCN